VSSCSICHTRAEDAAPAGACAACQYRLDYVLRQLVAEVPLLQDRLAPYRSPSTGTRHGGAAHPPLPVDVRVVDLLASRWLPDPDGQDDGGIPLGPLLVGWCSLLAGSYPTVSRHGGSTVHLTPAITHYSGGTIYVVPGAEPVPRTAGGLPGWAAWLRAYIPYAATWDRAPELWAAMEDALRRVRQVTGTQPRTRTRHAPCPRCQTFALAVTDGEYHVRCHACGHRMDPEEYAAHAAQTLPGLTATAVWIATAPARDDAPHDAHDAHDAA
jgi:hypothetical protein